MSYYDLLHDLIEEQEEMKVPNPKDVKPSVIASAMSFGVFIIAVVALIVAMSALYIIQVKDDMPHPNMEPIEIHQRPMVRSDVPSGEVIVEEE